MTSVGFYDLPPFFLYLTIQIDDLHRSTLYVKCCAKFQRIDDRELEALEKKERKNAMRSKQQTLVALAKSREVGPLISSLLGHICSCFLVFMVLVGSGAFDDAYLYKNI